LGFPAYFRPEPTKPITPFVDLCCMSHFTGKTYADSWPVPFWAQSQSVIAVDHSSPAQARSMLMKAIAHYKAVGRKQALADFTAQKPPFRDRDLYIVCVDRQSRISANGAFPDDVYASADLVKASNGEGAGTEAWKATEATGEVTVRYRWIKPTAHQMEWNLGFYARVGEDVCGVGACTAPNRSAGNRFATA
jgi:cytochrome c